VLVDKLSTNSLCGNIVWRKCKKKDGDKELERGFKGINVLGKGGHRKLNTIVLCDHVVFSIDFVICNKGCIQFLFSIV